MIIDLFFTFAKIGVFTFGGGYAMISLIENACVDNKKWITHDEMMNIIVIAESTPGPIGVNMATYVGYTVAGVPGAVVSTLGIISPCIVIILIISAFLNAFRSSPTVDRIFYGIRPASTALIASAGIGVMRLCLVDEAALAAGGGILSAFHLPQIRLMGLIWILTNLVKPLKKLHPMVFIALSAAAGILFSM